MVALFVNDNRDFSKFFSIIQQQKSQSIDPSNRTSFFDFNFILGHIVFEFALKLSFTVYSWLVLKTKIPFLCSSAGC